MDHDKTDFLQSEGEVDEADAFQLAASIDDELLAAIAQNGARNKGNAGSSSGYGGKGQGQAPYRKAYAKGKGTGNVNLLAEGHEDEAVRWHRSLLT